MHRLPAGPASPKLLFFPSGFSRCDKVCFNFSNRTHILLELEDVELEASSDLTQPSVCLCGFVCPPFTPFMSFFLSSWLPALWTPDANLSKKDDSFTESDEPASAIAEAVLFLAPISLRMVTATMKIKHFAHWGKSYDKPKQCVKKQRHHFAHKDPNSQSDGFSSSHVLIWEMDHKEGWTPKDWCFRIVVLEKTLKSSLGQKGDQTNQP